MASSRRLIRRPGARHVPIKAPSKTYRTTIFRDGSMCYIPVAFDPKPVFGKIRAPVKVTVNGFTFASTISPMGHDGPCIPFRRSNREAAGLEGGETLDVTVALDTSERKVTAPADLTRALRAAKLTARWAELSYTHQKEHVDAIENAKAPETRARRIAAAIKMLAAATPSRKRQSRGT
ncbi:MAG TPA: YdeI/OmpD-associated family protein [Kofleriaceae bacterium]|nr:YdeI/OmpD-associated family protein [Kofleriaceae bacterium]